MSFQSVILCISHRRNFGQQSIANAYGTARLPDGQPRPTLFGPSLLGVWTFDASGRNVLVAVDGRSDPPDGKRMFLSYSGPFEFDGARPTTFVDAASDPNILNVPQVRDVRFDGDKMILSPPVVTEDKLMCTAS